MRSTTSFKRIGLLLLAVFTAAAILGCDAMGEEETPEITPEYLSGEYAQQLINDGAEKLLGSMELSIGDSGDVEMILHPKEIVKDDSQEKGYRIDSFALNRTFIVPEQAYVSYLPPGDDQELQILTPQQFYTAVGEEYEEFNTNFAEYGDRRLYDVYALDNQVLLILAHPLND